MRETGPARRCALCPADAAAAGHRQQPAGPAHRRTNGWEPRRPHPCIAVPPRGDAVLLGPHGSGLMGYTAVHAGWGQLDASLDDLGCGRSWADVHRVKGLEQACPECRGRVFARVSPPHRARHFYHQVRPRDCELANESPEHHLLKLELATAARAAGFRAELEVGNEARTWRADVLVFDEQDRPAWVVAARGPRRGGLLGGDGRGAGAAEPAMAEVAWQASGGTRPRARGSDDAFCRRTGRGWAASGRGPRSRPITAAR